MKLQKPSFLSGLALIVLFAFLFFIILAILPVLLIILIVYSVFAKQKLSSTCERIRHFHPKEPGRAETPPYTQDDGTVVDAEFRVIGSRPLDAPSREPETR